MIIAVNTRCRGGDFPEDLDNFTFTCFSILAKKHPQHQFLFITDQPFDEKYLTAKNSRQVIAGPAAKHPLLWQYWYNYKLPAVLKKNKVTLFFSTDSIVSLRTRIPQYLLMADTDCLQYPDYFEKKYVRFFKSFTAKFITKAKTIIVLSEYSKNNLLKQYKNAAKKTIVIRKGVNETPCLLTTQQKEGVKEKYTEGKEYFLFVGQLSLRNNLLNLLKAFSIFKKRQKSNMQLIIASISVATGDAFTTALQTYKYKKEVQLLNSLSSIELTQITAAAYAFVYPVFLEGFSTMPIQAMQSNVPVICSNTGSLTELCGNAACYVNPADFTDIAEKMMQLFKDETKRQEFIKAGEIKAKEYHWEQTTAAIWDSLSTTIQV